MEKDQKIIKHKKRNKIRLHYEGNKTLILGGIFIAAIIAIAFWLIGCNWITWSITAVLLAVYLIVVNFFRCPIRYFQQDTENVIVAPADGKVVVVEEVEETEYFKDKRMMVSIFMSLFNVHANWIPCDGIVKKVEHQDGNFKKAYLPKASTENERSTVIIETPEGVEIMARQIAGAMARRIVTYAEEGQECFVDDHLGFIKFGSRVDVFLPLGSEVCVKLGQKTVGNETVIAKLK